jgi:heme exporter protein A
MAEKKKPSLSAEGLAIRRGPRTLFRNLSFAVQPGDYLEIRGPNGAGKTSLLRALAGFLRPFEGRVSCENLEEPALGLHFVGHLNGLKGGATARAHLQYWAGLLGGGDRLQAAAQALAIVAVLDLPARVLSQGQQRRLALARLLIAERPIWLLDEPGAALDQAGRALVADLVASHCGKGGVAIAAVHEALGPTPAQIVTLAPSAPSPMSASS